MAAKQSNAERFRQSNEERARIILADIERFGGEESLMVRWARLVLNPPAERTKPETGRAA